MKNAARSFGNSRIFWATTFSVGGAPSGASSRTSVRTMSRLEAAPVTLASSPLAHVAVPVILPASA